MWYIHIVELYSAVKNELCRKMDETRKYIDRGNNGLEKQALSILPYMWILTTHFHNSMI